MTNPNRPTPWRQVVRLRDELKSGELTLAEFAADLHEVTLAAGTRPAYEDPAKFFSLTFPTYAIRGLVRDVADRLAGHSDKAVRQLELTYGGGKTHTLITLYHLFQDPAALPAIPAVEEFRQAVGRELPQARVVALCVDKIDAEKGIEGVRGPYGERRALRHPWSVLAYQLAGDEGLRALHAEAHAEERDTPPAEPLLTELLRRPQADGLATLILVDEVLMFARQKAGLAPVWRHRIQDFFQYLVQAAVKADRCALVASLLSTDPKAESDAIGKQLKGDLFDVFRRQREEGIQPVAKEDVGEVLRRRLFVHEDIQHPDSYRPHVIAAVRGLGKLDKATKRAEKAEEERFLASYPFHPDLTEVFYTRWTQLAAFQRTRGILRTLAIGLREAAQWDECPVAGPAVLLAAPGEESASDALAELTTVADAELGGAQTAWKQLLEKELRLARQAQQELPALAARREVEQAVAAVFLHSQHAGKASTAELLLLVGTGAPDAIELDKGLERWREISWFLDDEDGAAADVPGRRALPRNWRLGHKPNLRQMHDEALRHLRSERVDERLLEAIRKTGNLTAGAKAAGAVLHLLPQQPADVADDVRFRFAVLGPEAASESGKPSALARRFLDETTGSDRPRVHRNALVLAAPSREGLEAARAAVGKRLGWEDVESEISTLQDGKIEGQANLARQHRLKTNLKEAGARLPDAVRQAYGIVVTTDTENRVHAFRLSAEGGPLFAQVQADSRARIQDTAVEPAALLPGGPYELWREDESSRRVADLADAFARHPRLPKLLKPEVVRDTVLFGVKQGLLVARLARPDGTGRTWWRDRVDPEAANDPGLEAILPERAKLTGLGPGMLDPAGGRLPGLWSEGRCTLDDLLQYFGGDRTVPVGVDGFDEVTAPRCAAAVLQAAVAGAVESGTLWLVAGPASLWREAPPESALAGSAELRARPEKIPPSELLPEAVPHAWKGGRTNGSALCQAVSLARDEAMPWGLLREGVRDAVKTRWLRIVEGAIECGYHEAGQLVLERPKSLPPRPSPKPVEEGPLLEGSEVQDFADSVPELAELAAGYGIRFRVGTVLSKPAPEDVRRQINERLAEISPDLKLE